jgi:hypothetical protein
METAMVTEEPPMTVLDHIEVCSIPEYEEHDMDAAPEYPRRSLRGRRRSITLATSPILKNRRQMDRRCTSRDPFMQLRPGRVLKDQGPPDALARIDAYEWVRTTTIADINTDTTVQG